MTKDTAQINFWKSDFGKQYTERSIYTTEEFDALDTAYANSFGMSKTEMNNFCIADVDRNAKVLEVGCNVGYQLRHLQKMGFKNLYGIELQWVAVDKSKNVTQEINIIQGSAFDIPFRDDYFDLVFTNGFLIHVAPDDLLDAIKEINRVSNKYIWGIEYYAENLEEIIYREHTNVLWKRNFCQFYLENIPRLNVVKKMEFEFPDGKIDQMFLLSKNP